jgi:hypothetical protein
MLLSAALCSGCACLVVPPLGALGIILANCLNLVLRIGFSVHFLATRVTPPRHAKGADMPAVGGALYAALPGWCVTPLFASVCTHM